MLRAFETFDPKKALPRMAVDFGLVHACMVASLAGCVLFHTAIGNGALASIVIQIVSRYYWQDFFALSLLFPIIFSLNGFYTKAESYSNRRKAVMVARGVGISVLVFLAANYLLFRMDIVPRSVILMFCVLVIASLTLVRVAKAIVMDNFDISPKHAMPVRTSRTVLVVGGAGYIGSILVRRLLEENYRVRVMDNLIYGPSAISDLQSHANFELIEGDCRNIQNVVSAVRGVDAIVDLAAIVGDPACEQDKQSRWRSTMRRLAC